MKKLFLLLLPIIAIGQTKPSFQTLYDLSKSDSTVVIYEPIKPQFTSNGDLILPKAEIMPVWRGLVRGNQCETLLTDCTTAVDSLGNIIVQMKNDDRKYIKENQALRNERDDLSKQRDKIQFDLGQLKGERPKWYNNRWLWFGLGVLSAGVVVHELK